MITFDPLLSWVLGDFYATLVLTFKKGFFLFTNNGRVDTQFSSINTVNFDVFQDRAAKYLAQPTKHDRTHTDLHVCGQKGHKEAGFSKRTLNYSTKLQHSSVISFKSELLLLCLHCMSQGYVELLELIRKRVTLPAIIYPVGKVSSTLFRDIAVKIVGHSSVLSDAWGCHDVTCRRNLITVFALLIILSCPFFFLAAF